MSESLYIYFFKPGWIITLSKDISMNNRRNASTRKIDLLHQLAIFLVKKRIMPSQVSILSSVFSLVAALLFISASSHKDSTLHLSLENQILLLTLALIGIQLRLACNLIDGLMATEGALKTKSSELFNDVPDRLSDVMILLGVGYFAQQLTLSWLACVLALSTAYIRVLGASLTGKHDFVGPMAKQNRMLVITLGTLSTIFEIALDLKIGYFLYLSLIVICLGSALTCARRLYRIYLILEKG